MQPDKQRRLLYHHRTQAVDAQGIHIHELSQAFIRNGWQVEMVSITKDEAIGKANRDEKIYQFADRIPRILKELLEILYNIFGILRLLHKIHQIRPVFIYERYSLFNVAGGIASRLTGIPLIVEVNAPLAFEMSSYGTLYFKKFAQFIETWIINHSFRTITVTQVLKDILIQNGAYREKIEVMYNGINIKDFPPPPDEHEKEKGTFIIGFIGWFRKWHGLEAVLDAMQFQEWNKRSIKLLLIGDGPAKNAIAEKASQLGIADSVTITGAVARDRLINILGQIDVAIQPSATSYACPMKIIEYMAAGKAIVAPDQPNIRELLSDGVNALLFKQDDWVDFSSKINVLVNDRQQALRIGAAARDTVVTKDLTWDANVRKVLAMLPFCQISSSVT